VRGSRRRRLLPALALVLLFGATGAPTEGPAPLAHDLHIAYADLAVESSLIAGRVRMFKDDLEGALGALVDADAVALVPGPDADALVTRYLREHLRFVVDGQALELTLLDAGADELDREPVWWALVQLRAPGPVERLAVRNTLLFERFDDQRNIMKLVHFPDETQRTYYFAPGEEEHQVRF